MMSLTAHPEIIPAIVAIDPITGAHLRGATAAEVAAYYTCNPPAPFDRPVRVGDVLIDAYYGPGEWFGGAGF